MSDDNGHEDAPLGKVPVALLEYRVRQMEIEVRRIEKRLETLATRDDVAQLSATIANSAAASRGWWQNILLGPAIVAVIGVLANWLLYQHH